MRKKIFSMLFIITLLLWTVAVNMNIPVKATPDSTWLYVDTYNEVISTVWVKTGFTPYLSTQNQPTDYGYVSSENKEWGVFYFADLAGTPDINSVNLSIYGYADEKLQYSIWNSSAGGWTEYTDIIDRSGWGWYTANVSDVLTNDAEVDNATVKFRSRQQGGSWAGTVGVDCARLGVDYAAAAEYSLTVNIIGSGSVTKVPDQATYASGTSVELTANPVPGWSFSGWSGDLTGSTNPKNITMDSNKTVTATFILPSIAVVPNYTSVATTLGENFTVSIYTNYTGSDVFAYEFSLTYDPSILHGVACANGDLIVGGTATFMNGTFNNTIGKLSVVGAMFYYVFPPIPTTSGPGILANVTFTVVGYGSSDITLGDDTKLKGCTDPSDAGTIYNIISAVFNPDQIYHGYFRNTGLGDVNGDHFVDIFDIALISAHWYPEPPIGPLGYCRDADINLDDSVNISDINIASDNWGNYYP